MSTTVTVEWPTFSSFGGWAPSLFTNQEIDEAGPSLLTRSPKPPIRDESVLWNRRGAENEAKDAPPPPPPPCCPCVAEPSVLGDPIKGLWIVLLENTVED
eukprot:GILK01015389.1.p2 GENE.GILK01015389.1~~GILK01015389.1.p2  ORF type:complete len:100 (-),score=12.45 GILK01015389.1:642-941(-)